MTEDEVDIYSNYGRHALQIHRAAMRENNLKLASSEAKIADLKADAESWQKQADDRLSDALEFGRRAEKAEARVKELENTKANLDLAEISITTMKAKIEPLQQQLVAKQPTEKPSSRFDGEYDTEYHQGFNGHGY